MARDLTARRCPAPSERWSAAVVAVVAALVASVGLASCSGSADRLDRASVEEQVSRAVAAVVAPAVAEVTCPDELRRGPRAEFRCEVVLADPSGTLPVAVRQHDGGGDLDVVALRAVLSSEDVARSLRASLKDEFARSFQVDCGDGVATVREPGDELICRANDKTSRRSVVVTVVDEQGTLAFEVADP